MGRHSHQRWPSKAPERPVRTTGRGRFQDRLPTCHIESQGSPIGRGEAGSVPKRPLRGVDRLCHGSSSLGSRPLPDPEIARDCHYHDDSTKEVDHASRHRGPPNIESNVSIRTTAEARFGNYSEERRTRRWLRLHPYGLGERLTRSALRPRSRRSL
jgi:hypothetical protein